MYCIPPGTARVQTQFADIARANALTLADFVNFKIKNHTFFEMIKTNGFMEPHDHNQ